LLHASNGIKHQGLQELKKEEIESEKKIDKFIYKVLIRKKAAKLKKEKRRATPKKKKQAEQEGKFVNQVHETSEKGAEGGKHENLPHDDLRQKSKRENRRERGYGWGTRTRKKSRAKGRGPSVGEKITERGWGISRGGKYEGGLIYF